MMVIFRLVSNSFTNYDVTVKDPFGNSLIYQITERRGCEHFSVGIDSLVNQGRQQSILVPKINQAYSSFISTKSHVTHNSEMRYRSAKLAL